MSEQLPDLYVRDFKGDLVICSVIDTGSLGIRYTPHSKLQEEESKNTQLAGLLDAAVGDYNDAKEKLQEADERIKNLTDLLVSMTHHEGALAFYRERWEPIVTAELDRRMQELRSTTND